MFGYLLVRPVQFRKIQTIVCKRAYSVKVPLPVYRYTVYLGDTTLYTWSSPRAEPSTVKGVEKMNRLML
jgi:hypothetical protein